MPTSPIRVLIAFDKFKDSLSARDACNVAAGAVAASHPGWVVDLCPFADGGDGFGALLSAVVGGTSHDVVVTGPRHGPVKARLNQVPVTAISFEALTLLGWESMAEDSSVAVIDMASASGLALLDSSERDPWQATSQGLGQLIARAAEDGVAGIVLGLGGSATHDLALPALAVLGYEFRTASGQLVADPIPATWKSISSVERLARCALPPLCIACDVSNPTFGPNGAAAVYGPQKGLRPEDVSRIDSEGMRLATLLCAACDKAATLAMLPGAGAAGGAGFGLGVGLDATLVSGANLVAAWIGLEARLALADIILTGEGRFDASSLSGKGPAVLARRAVALGKAAHVFAGSVAPGAELAGVQVHAITPDGTALDLALARAAENLERAVGQQL